jgi:hypothetical protein
VTERDKIKQRIAKLLNLTTDRGASEAEMQAAERAAELMAHYDIQASELQIKSARAIAKHAVIRRYGNLRIAVPVARPIAALCDSKYWLDAERGVTFFGLPEDAEVAAYLFDLISNTILAEITSFAPAASTGLPRRMAARSSTRSSTEWKTGLASGLKSWARPSSELFRKPPDALSSS